MGRRRKLSPITLATVRALKAIGDKTTETLGRPDDPARPGLPTPELLQRAGYTVAMQLGTGNLQVIGAPTPLLGHDGVIRVDQAPLDRLHSRNRLDEADPARNFQLWQAGVKLRGHHHRAGLSGFVAAANDPTRVGRTDPSQRVAITETMERGRRALRTAESAMDPGAWRAVQAVVIDERTLQDTGHMLGFPDAHGAAAVAIDRLRRGLSALAELWGYLPPERPDALAPDTAANGNGHALKPATAA